MAQLKRDVQALRGRLAQAGETNALKIHVDEGQVQVLLQVGPHWDHECLSNASSAFMVGWHCLLVTITSPLASSNSEPTDVPLGAAVAITVAYRGAAHLWCCCSLLLLVSARRLAAALTRRSSLHLTPCCHLLPPSMVYLQAGSCTKECVVLYLSADDYPNSQMMGMCNNDNELNSKLEGLSEQFEYGASIEEVLQQVCLPACL